MQQIFHGIAVSPGIVEGMVYLIDKGSLKIPKYWIHDRELDEELSRYQEALALSKKQVRKLMEKISQSKRREHVLILEAHVAMLDDILLKEETAGVIRVEKINAEWALEKTQRKLIEALSNIDEEYLRERKEDISHVINRVLNNLLGKLDEPFQKIDKAVVIVTHELSPVDLAHMPRNKVRGFVTDVGGRTSHVGIVAASMEIPAVLGVESLTQYTHSGDRIIIDGIHGVVIINPTSDTLTQYRDAQDHYLKTQAALIAERDLPHETHDHHPVRLLANMEFPEEIPFIMKQGAQGVGLLRTEFLFLNSKTPPTEDEQFDYYRKVLEAFKPNPVTVRTYDLGGDKKTNSLTSDLGEMNPAMGLRAIRYCLREPELFRAQLRAMYRASAFGEMKIMFPMIADFSELVESKKMAQDVLDELRRDKVKVGKSVPIGMMVETPAAAMISDLLAKHVDFFSVGTNDLIQYTLAVDRGNEHVAYLYNPLHPAILIMLERIAESARQNNISVNLCGEMASDPLFLPILVALGFDELSMNAAVLPNVKHILRHLDMSACQKIFAHVSKSTSSEDALDWLKKEMARRFPDYFEV